VPTLDEFGLIRVWTEARHSKEFLNHAGVKLGIGDDAAIVGGGSQAEEWLLTMDTMVEEVHFRNETMGEWDVGYKALAANISDIAAMGGIPKYVLVSVSVPSSWNAERMKLLFDGLYTCAECYDIAIIGGDTTSAPQQLVVSITLLGVIETGQAIRRDGAKPGQLVFLTGPTGLSAAGLHALLNKGKLATASISPRLLQAHQRPVPSVKAGRILVEKRWGASLNDVSDGLASEAWEIAEASQVKVVLKEPLLPLSGEVAAYARANRIQSLDFVLYGGEDYVLLGTVEPQYEQVMKEYFRKEGIPLFIVGEIEAGLPDVVLETALGTSKRIDKRGYNHFPKG